MRRLLPAAALCLLAGLAAASAGAKDIVAPARGAVVGTNKADRIAAEGGAANTIRCKAGRDVVTADPGDKLAADCEVVSLRVSSDPYRNASSQHQAQVEPDSFGFGSTEVTTFQSGRFNDGGASNIGWATTTDAGKTWKSGFLPGLTQFSAPPGPYPRASDPVTTYDAKHGIWMIVSLGFSPTSNAMLISRSPDGRGWDLPVTAWRSEQDLDFDKPWIACDNWQTSPYFGNCYLTWADFGTNKLVTQTSHDGGLTWSAPVTSPAFGNDSLNGTQPVVRPDGSLYVLFSGRTILQETISTDGGRRSLRRSRSSRRTSSTSRASAARRSPRSRSTRPGRSTRHGTTAGDGATATETTSSSSPPGDGRVWSAGQASPDGWNRAQAYVLHAGARRRLGASGARRDHVLHPPGLPVPDRRGVRRLDGRRRDLEQAAAAGELVR